MEDQPRDYCILITYCVTSMFYSLDISIRM